MYENVKKVLELLAFDYQLYRAVRKSLNEDEKIQLIWIIKSLYRDKNPIRITKTKNLVNTLVWLSKSFIRLCQKKHSTNLSELFIDNLKDIYNQLNSCYE